jgi:hypothetical protein
MSKDNDSVFLIELDCIFDTRLSTLALFGEQALLDNFQKPYWKRVCDSFIGVGIKKFLEEYSKRDKLILLDSIHTPMLDFIVDFVKQTILFNAGSPIVKNPVIMINVYPYDLTETEKVKIVEGIVIKTGDQCDVELVNMSPEQITPEFLDKNIAVVSMYEYIPWLELQSTLENGFKKHTCPSVSLLAPEILFKELTDEDKNTIIKDKLDIKKSLEDNAAPMICLQLLPVEYFSCAIRPK